MLADFADSAPLVRQVFDRASAVLGYDAWALAQSGPEDRLNSTEITQPLLLTASVALWELWRARGGAMPARMVGHSLGEYSALVCAGALDFTAAVALVRLRGQLMQSAVPPGAGAMAAILGLDDAAVREVCAGVAGTVVAANLNAPGQVVIAGESGAVDAAIAALGAAGAKRAMRLAVSVPSHSPLMAPAAAGLAAALAGIDVRVPVVPVLHNVDTAPCAEPAAIRERLVAQLTSPVRWSDCVAAAVAAGSRDFVECGPGKVLGGLVKRIERDSRQHALGTAAGFEQALQAAGA